MVKKLFRSNLFLITLLTFVVLLGSLRSCPPLENLEKSYYDWWAARFKITKSPPLALVLIDDKSLQAIGSWPWPRSLVADMIRRISENGAQALGLTLLFSEEELNPGIGEIRKLREIARVGTQPGKTAPRIPDSAFSDAEKRLDQDNQLIAAVRSARNVVLPFRLLSTATPTGGGSALSGILVINSLKSEKTNDTAKSGIGSLHAWLEERNDQTVPFGSVREPYRELAGKAGALGHLNLAVDSDGVARQVPLLIEYQGRLLPSFALQLFLKYKKEDFKKIDPQPHGLQIDDTRIATDQFHRMLLACNPGLVEIETHSFVDLINAPVDTGLFKDRVVLLGLSGGEYGRYYRSAGGTEISETELFGHVLANLFSSSRITRPAWALPTEILVMLYFSIFLVTVIPRVSLKAGGIILIIFLTTWIGAGMLLFWLNGYWLKLFAPITVAIGGYGLVGIKSFARQKSHEKTAADKALGLSFQGQGLLDMALEKFMECPIDDPSIKNALYNIGLDFERKRMTNKALAAYERILSAGNFKDVKKRVKKIKSKGGTKDKSLSGGLSGTSLLLDGTDTHPTLGRYEILKEIGRGAMGTVFLGKDPRINRNVAIKTMPYGEIEPHELDEFKTRFFREAEAAGKLSHPNIVAIYDAGEEHDMAYIAMELLEGCELTDYCRSDNLLPVKQVVEIVTAVASALDYAHREGVIHRDIKPSNIMLVKDQQVKVTDFGIARVIDASQTQTGITLGTPSYMSPEQVSGKKVDGRSDLFSLGIVFYELLTGKRPFAADGITSILYAIVNSDYPSLSRAGTRIPSCCVEIVDKLLKKNLTARFSSAAQVVKALEACRAKL